MDKQALKTRESSPEKSLSQDFTDQLIEPFSQLRTQVDRLFENFPFHVPKLNFGQFALPALTPAIEMSETAKGYKISAELPGLEPDSVEVTFEDGLLRIAGEKREEREENEKGYRYAERSYGSFERLVTLPAGADENSIAAKFRNGVLTVTIAKRGEEKRNVRHIKIKKDA
jgi:HSP20 family protein